jgi:hypothetical protein
MTSHQPKPPAPHNDAAGDDTHALTKEQRIALRQERQRQRRERRATTWQKIKRKRG